MKRILTLLFLLALMKGFAQTPAYVPLPGLVGYWPFDGNANDLSPNVNNGTVFGATPTTDRFNNPAHAYNFDGLSNYILVPSNPSLSNFSGLTISVWVKTNGFMNTQSIVAKWWQLLNCGANSDNYLVALVGNSLDFATNFNNFGLGSVAPTLPNGMVNTWTHLVFEFNSSPGTLSMYLNGNLFFSAPVSGTSICMSTNDLFFGADIDGSHTQMIYRYFNGGIDDIGIWNRPLTPCEIGQLYTSTGLTVTATSAAICAGSTTTLTANGANTYTWLPSGSGSSLAVTPSVTTTYTVNGTATGGCVKTNTFTIVVNPLPVVSATSSPNPVCAGSSATLTASGAGPFTWLPSGTGSLIVVFPQVSTVYTVTGNAAGCSSTQTVSVVVAPLPSITINASSTSLCIGSSVTLTAAGAGTYTWLPATSGSTLTFIPTTSSVYTVSGTLNGCSSTSTIGISVIPFPTLTINSSANSICQGSSATLTAGGASTYTWLPSMSGTTLLVTPTASTVYTVSGTLNGCSSTSTLGITVNPFPTLTINSSSNSICSGSSATLTAGGAGTYTWLPATNGPTLAVTPIASSVYTVSGMLNGCSSTGTIGVFVTPSPTLIISSSANSLCIGSTATLTAGGAGTYTWLPATNGPTLVVMPTASSVYTVSGTLNGCNSIGTIGISINPSPTFIISSSANTVCAGTSATLMASGADSYSWLPSGSGPVIIVSPLVATHYTVTATNTLTGCSATQTISLAVNPLPVISVTGPTAAVCAGMQATLTAGGANSYTWYPGALHGSSISVSPSGSMVYTVSGITNNCTGTQTVSVIISPTPTLIAMASPSVICLGQSSTLTVTGLPNPSWIINNAPVVSSTVVVSPAVNTVYQATGTNTAGCPATATVQVNIDNATLAVNISNSVICKGESVEIDLNSGGLPAFTLYPGGQSGSHIALTPTASIVYTVFANSACHSSSTFSITVNNCTAPAFGISNAISEPEMYSSTRYKINFTVIVSNLSAMPLTDVRLSTDLNATFPQPCSYTVITHPTLHSLNSALNANTLFNGVSDLNLIMPLTGTLSPSKKDTIVYSVLLEPNGFYGQVKNSVYGYAVPLNRLLYLPASDSSETGFDCDPDHDGNPGNNNIATPIDIKTIDFFIPEGFSPNDDGVNDLFVIKGLNGRSAKLNIFNRWGNKVYSKEGVDLSWDGKVNTNAITIGNNKLPAATYFYTLEFSGSSKKGLSGFVVLQY